MSMVEISQDSFAADDAPRQNQGCDGGLPSVPPAPWRAFALILLLLAGIFALFWQFHGELKTLESSVVRESGGGERLKAMNQQMEVLRDRLHGLMADSVEIRLKTLERNLAAGKVSGDDLILFQTLQNDMQSLEAYATVAGTPGLDYAAREHPRFQPVGMAAGAVLSQGEMLREISRLRTLLYLCLTGLLAAGGVTAARCWIGYRKPPALTSGASAPPPLLSRNHRPGGSG